MNYLIKGWIVPGRLELPQTLPETTTALDAVLLIEQASYGGIGLDPEYYSALKCYPASAVKIAGKNPGPLRVLGEPQRIWFERPVAILGEVNINGANLLVVIDHKDFCGASFTDLFVAKYPRLVSHMICESLGYATPACAARILYDAHRRQENWCEWIYSCYNRDPLPAAQNCFRSRKYHNGYMSSYDQARAIVHRMNTTGKQPEFASWF